MTSSQLTIQNTNISIIKKHVDFWTEDEFRKVIQSLDEASYFFK